MTEPQSSTLVKIFHGDECRRFYVCDYTDLMNEIEDLFNITRESAILHYVDKDKDIVTMRKEGEFRAAVNSVSGNEIVFTLANRDEPRKCGSEFAVSTNNKITHTIPLPLRQWPNIDKVRSQIVAKSESFPSDAKIRLVRTDAGVAAKCFFKSPKRPARLTAVVRFASKTGMHVPIILELTVHVKANRCADSSSSSSSTSSSSSCSSSSSDTTESGIVSPSTICLSDIPYVEGIPLGDPESPA
eukprot:TRINITY_DN5030_c3_g1_i1.p1 TRINITY_DN5030_c3_g1~~TRINITY_DN5030_c3_g1_i1.p1  ORF type:complete len:243 (+),score=33.46 TRINITY_DN5030_c3_g1_i1:126-854(+)